ncbi:XIAP-associated factor 1 [Nelusetta ayraudi]|uniref:XIAP-associated factor 1 n=1 Tax=Nelusetta ayraudi TaxID=303726 RepID=UPI003F71A5E9
MDEAEPQRFCGQCHRYVAESNFTLHEMHCRRFLCVCPDCEETVPKEHLEQHRQEQHTLVRCSKCNVKVERGWLGEHESDECVERLRKCDFCELDMPWKELQEHGLACGSRTELCRECGSYVTLRDQPDHSQTCSSTGQASALRPPTRKPGLRETCRRCKASLSAEDLFTHECVPAAEADDEQQNGLSGRLKSTFLSDREAAIVDGDDPDQISPCPHCHLALPLLTLRWHQAKCQRLRPRK